MDGVVQLLGVLLAGNELGHAVLALLLMLALGVVLELLGVVLALLRVVLQMELLGLVLALLGVVLAGNELGSGSCAVLMVLLLGSGSASRESRTSRAARLVLVAQDLPACG